MTVKFSIILAACNAGYMLKETIASIDLSCSNRDDYEIIVVDDCSEDKCCEGLPSHVRLFKAPSRLGCSGSRNYGGKQATGDVLIISDPHCNFPTGVLSKLANLALRQDAVIQPSVILEGHSRRQGATIQLTDKGLTTKVVSRLPKYPIMIGSIYVFSRTVWNKLGGYSPLPGWWDYDENYYSSIAYRLGMSVVTATELPRCTHRKYRKTGRLPFSLPQSDRWRNGHWFHAVCFPDRYTRVFKPILDKVMPVDMTKDFANPEFQSISDLVRSNSVRRESWFLRNVVTKG